VAPLTLGKAVVFLLEPDDQMEGPAQRADVGVEQAEVRVGMALDPGDTGLGDVQALSDLNLGEMHGRPDLAPSPFRRQSSDNATVPQRCELDAEGLQEVKVFLLYLPVLLRVIFGKYVGI
jgi:hypothetical protein